VAAVDQRVAQAGDQMRLADPGRTSHILLINTPQK
jgi:hypothetical protein